MTGYFQRIALNAVKPGGSIQPVLDPLFSPSSLTTGPVSEETEEQLNNPVPTEFAERTKPRPSPDLPDAPAHQPRPSPKQDGPLELTESLLPISAASVPSPQEKAEPLIVPRPAQKRGHQSTGEPAEPRPETTSERQIKAVEDPAIDAAPSNPAAFVTSSTSSFVPLVTPLLPVSKENDGPIIIRRLPGSRSDQSQEDSAKPRNESILKPPPKQEIERSSEETKPGAIAVSADSHQFAAFRPTSSSVTRGSEKMGSQNRHTARLEPDEIQIHIGRIEVVAVPPVTVAQSSPKPKHEAPSLDEYLRRRRGRSV